MARKGYEQRGALPTIARFREHEINQLLVICIAALGGHQRHNEGQRAVGRPVSRAVVSGAREERCETA